MLTFLLLELDAVDATDPPFWLLEENYTLMRQTFQVPVHVRDPLYQFKMGAHDKTLSSILSIPETSHLPPPPFESVYIKISDNGIVRTVAVPIKFLRTMQPEAGFPAVVHSFVNVKLCGKIVQILSKDGEQCQIRTQRGSEAPIGREFLALLRPLTAASRSRR